MVPSTGYITCYDLVPYDTGFMLMAPTREEPEIIPEFEPREKLFSVLKTSMSGARRWMSAMLDS